MKTIQELADDYKYTTKFKSISLLIYFVQKDAIESAARIAEDPKWAADPRAVSCDQPRSIALQIRELMK